MDNNKVKIGYYEVTAIILVLIGTKAFTGFPRFIVEAGLTAGWIIILESGLLSIALWLLISALLFRFPGKSLTQINNLVLGPAFGILANLIFLSYITINNSNLLRLFSEAVILTALPEAPVSSLTFLFIIPALVAVHIGIEAIGRSTYIALPFIVIGTISVLAAIYPFMDHWQLLPLFGSGVGTVLTHGLLSVSGFSEVLILAYFVPYFSFDGSKLRRLGIFSIAVSTLAFVLIVAVYLMVIPVPGAQENIVPFYQLSRMIYLGRYFQRVEAIFILFWTFTAFLWIALGLAVIAIIVRDMLKIPYYRPILPALSTLFVSIGLTPADFMQSIEIEKFILGTIGWQFTFIPPCVVYMLSLLRKKGGRVKHDQG